MKKVMLGFLCGVVLMLAVGFATDKLNVKYVDYKVVVNGKETELKNQPLLKDGGTTYLPLRELAEVAGYKVGFNKGVITLNDSAPTTSTATPQPTSTPKPSSSPQAEAIVWKKLPQTWEKDGISITVESIELQQTLTLFNITVSNNSSGSVRLHLYDRGLLGDTEVEGKQAKTYSASRNHSFDNPTIGKGKEVSGVIQKGRIDDGTENVTLTINVDSGKYEPTFYIDTTDLWK